MKQVATGTPLSPSATKVMLLGSGELGNEVIIALQRLGVETIAVDRYANASGHQVAHRAHVINMADGPALRALMKPCVCPAAMFACSANRNPSRAAAWAWHWPTGRIR
jgi:formate-dependent phosphoribosylglycinamide formyltransferase (GAR transformylase)